MGDENTRATLKGGSFFVAPGPVAPEMYRFVNFRFNVRYWWKQYAFFPFNYAVSEVELTTGANTASCVSRMLSFRFHTVIRFFNHV